MAIPSTRPQLAEGEAKKMAATTVARINIEKAYGCHNLHANQTPANFMAAACVAWEKVVQTAPTT